MGRGKKQSLRGCGVGRGWKPLPATPGKALESHRQSDRLHRQGTGPTGYEQEGVAPEEIKNPEMELIVGK